MPVRLHVLPSSHPSEFKVVVGLGTDLAFIGFNESHSAIFVLRQNTVTAKQNYSDHSKQQATTFSNTSMCGAHPNNHAAADSTVIIFRDADEATSRAIALDQDRTDRNYDSFDLSGIIRDIRRWSPELWEKFIPDNWQGRAIKQRPILFRFESESPLVPGHRAVSAPEAT